MRTRSSVAIAVFAVIALVVAGSVVYRLSPEVQFVHVLELRGRVLDAATGTPIAGAWVLTLPPEARDSWQEGIAEHQRDRVDDRFLRDEAGAKIGLGGGAPSWAEVRGNEDGRFTVRVGVPWSFRLAAGVFPTRRTPPARAGVGALHIQAQDGSTAVVEIAGGEWTVAPPDDPSALWATWDLGDVPVALKEER